MKRVLVILIVVAAVVVVVFPGGQPSRGPRTVLRDEQAPLEVAVVEAATGRPVAGAGVAVHDMGRGRFALTGDDGRCLLGVSRNLAAILRLRISAPGFRSAEHVLSGQRVRGTDSVTVELARVVRTVRGQVRVVGGAAGVRVSLRAVRPPAGVLRVAAAYEELTTAEDGSFELALPGSGSASLELLRRTERGAVGALVEIPSGTEAVDLGDIPLAGVAVTIRVEDEGSAPLADVPVVLRAAVDPGRAVRARTDGDGRAGFEVPAGRSGAVAGIVDVRVGNGIRGGFSVFSGRPNRLSVRR